MLTENSKDRVFNRGLPWISLISITTFLIYLNSVSGAFVFDDWPLIKDNGIIQSLANWKTILFHGYRPIRTLLLTVIYHFVGAEPPAYHVVNIFIHLLTVLAVYLFGQELTGRKTVAFASAFIFATHPIQTDAVSYISGMRDTLSTLFYVLGMICYLKYRHGGRGLMLAGGIACYVAGSLTKEMAATMLFGFVLYDFIRAYPSEAPGSLSKRLKDLFGTLLGVVRTYRYLYLSLFIGFCFTTYYYLFIRQSTVRVRLDGVDWYGGSMLLNYLTIPKIIVYYLKQIVWPAHLLVDYKFFPIVARSPYEAKALLAALGVLVLILLSVYLLGKQKTVAFGMIWFFMTLAPALNILPHHEFMAEHYLYLPMVGVALIGGWVLTAALDRSPSRTASAVLWLAFGLLITGYSVRTVLRNMDWQNDLTLSDSQLKIRPDSPRTLMEMGYLYTNMNLPESSEKSLRDSLRLVPSYGPALNDLAQDFLKFGQYEKALEYYESAIVAKVHQASKARQNKALVLMSLGRSEEGVAIFKKILDHDPNDFQAQLSLAYSSFFDGKYVEAREYLRGILTNRPADIESYFLLGEVYRKQLLLENAARVYDVILKIDPENRKAREIQKTVRENQAVLDRAKKLEKEEPDSAEAALSLAELYNQVQEYSVASEVLGRAIKSHPGNIDLWKKYEAALFSQEKYEEAMEASKKAVLVDPSDPGAHLMLARNYAAVLDFSHAASHVRITRGLNGELAGLGDLENLIEKLGPKEAEARRLLSQNPKDPEGLFLKGEVYFSIGMVDKSLEEYLKILEDHPDNLKAMYLAARMHVRQNSPSDTYDAIRLLEAILKESPGDSEAHNLLAGIYLVRLKNFESAYRHLKQSSDSDPEQKDIERVRGMAAALENYIHAVTVDKIYLLPYVVDEKQFEKWLMPAASPSSTLDS